VVEVPIEIAKYFYSQLFQFLSVSGKQMFFLVKIYLNWISPPQVSLSASSAAFRINLAKEPALKREGGGSFCSAGNSES